MEKLKYKNFTAELAIINHFENFKKHNIKLNNCAGEAYITKSKNNFELSFNGIFQYNEDKKIEVQINRESYIFKSIDFQKPFYSELPEISTEYTFDIDVVYKGDISNSSFFRMFFFDDSGRNNLFHFKIEAPKHDGVIPWAFDCTRITIKQNRYDIIQHKNQNQSYIIIENLDRITYDDFKQDSYAIQKGIGYLVGYMPGGENYIFSGNNFVYRRLSRQALKSIYYPVTSNPYSFEILHNHNEIAKEYENKLKVIPALVVSNFVSQIRENEELSVAIIFLMEATSLGSAVSMPGVFSVILEAFANIIIKKEKIRKI